MQGVAVNFLRRMRSMIEAAEQGRLTEDDLVTGRDEMNALLEQDWIMPKAVSGITILWKDAAESLGRILYGKAGDARADELASAWSAYAGLEELLKA